MMTRAILTYALAAGLLAGTAHIAHAQQNSPKRRGQRDCVVRKEPNGLIRGDRIPKGCVLIQEEDLPRQERRPAPTVGQTVGGRHFGPSQGHFGPLERHFGPSQRHFGPLQRHFGPTQRHFGPLQRHFGPLQRNFGSSSRSRTGNSRP
ncbi:MAG: hypothetical protein JSV86_04160 [Gemmatimonadota bacterium]|nr:MAG: hypothetical protein JSV86_04160 [Gemmatimonadota bacterium]